MRCVAKVVRQAVALWCAAALVAGCAEVADAGHGYEAGWRTGFISAIGPSIELPGGEDSDCRETQRFDPSIDLFAVVSYVTRRGALQHRVVPVDVDSNLKKGDWVLVNVEHCAAPVVRSGVSQ